MADVDGPGDAAEGEEQRGTDLRVATGEAPSTRWASGPAPAVTRVDGAADLPETLRYRLKNRLLGPPLVTEQLASERLGRPTALAVLSSDVISSSAYATEQALIPLIKVIGVAAFSLLMPVSVAVIVVLAFVTLSYLEVVKVYTKAGGAYVVARENFGPNVAQVAAVALLIDYTLTVAVSVAAGVAALTSVFPALQPGTTWIAVALVVLISYVNLRGVREAGKTFAFPTYFFIANMVILLAVGAVRAAAGQLHAHSIHQMGAIPAGSPGTGLLYGASLFVLLRSFASGGSALTGTEAISNGVSVFRRPEARNARITMVWMAVILGTLVLGVSALSAITHPVPYVSGTPTVLYQVGKYVYGTSGLGHALVDLLQAATVFILVLAANTSFTGFPFLASFAAEDSYLPRQLTRRGHRLVFSTGIIVLTVVSIALLVITNAQVDSLIPLYAIGVFTGFTMAGAGMVKYHRTHREPQWRRRAFINGTAAVLSAVVDLVIIITKFTEGAWTIVIVLPLGVFALIRLHAQYAFEEKELESGAVAACEAPILRRHVVIVLVDRLDMAVARALQYARSLTPDDLRAVHFDIDNRAARQLEEEWSRLGLTRLPLDIIECPDRRLGRAAVELVADAVVDGDTECTLLLPRRGFANRWQRLLHDRTADRIASLVSAVPHVAATIIPYQLSLRARRWWPGRRASRLPDGSIPGLGGPDPAELASHHDEMVGAKGRRERGKDKEPRRSPADVRLASRSAGTTPIGEVQWRHRVRVAGRVRSVRVQPRAGTANLECVLTDGTGALLLVFLGRPKIPGIEPGARLVAEGMVGAWGRRLAILNPDHELVAGPERDAPGDPA
ncbi:MAG TPA: amino acid permease [Acidimicrobiales bacterium]|nr:amino acid permease [Acidimicrobiales bacterium]